MKVALSFGSDRYAYWAQRISSVLSGVAPHLTVSDCSTLSTLESEAPEVIIGHENDALISYLKRRPEQLRWVQFMSAGLDCSLNALGRRPVDFHITNMRGIHAMAMSEYLLASLLHFEKHLDYFCENKKKHEWSRISLGKITGKRLLVCGAGGIGQRVGEVLSALGVKVEAIARTSGYRPPFVEVHELSALRHIIGGFDYVFCALPLTEQTYNVFDNDTIAAMKPGAVFVNIARGEMVNDEALITALRSGRLKGAALDVFRTEPLPQDSPWWDVPNLLLTPHISGRFDNGHDLGLEVLKRNMTAYLAGEPLATEVFPERGY